MKLLGIALLFAGASAHAQSVRQAREFLNGIYSWDTNENADDPLGDNKTYAPSLIRLFHLDQHLAGKGNIGKLDYDPLCSCQDPGGLHYAISSLALKDPRRASAKISLKDGASWHETLALDLLWTSNGWRIDDVHASRVHSLRAYLLAR